jgi:hypothetical protein
MLRNKRYNFAVQIVDQKEKKIKKLRKEIKELNTKLVKLRNDNIVNEKEQGSRMETTVENAGMEEDEIQLIKKENEKNQELLILGKKYNDINLAYNKVLENIKAMKEYDNSHPLNIKEEESAEKMEEKTEEKQNTTIKFTKEEEEYITEYEKFLKKILKAFNILYLCKSKQDFINLMREKGIREQNEKLTLDKGKRKKTKKITKRNTNKYDKHSSKTEVNDNNRNDEEEDISVSDPDKKILIKFIKEQKKEIDEFINVKKPTNTTKTK